MRLGKRRRQQPMENKDKTNDRAVPASLFSCTFHFLKKPKTYYIYYIGIVVRAAWVLMLVGNGKKKRTLSERKFYLSDLLFSIFVCFFLSTNEIFKKSSGTLSFGPTSNTKSFFFSYSKHGAPPKSITR